MKRNHIQIAILNHFSLPRRLLAEAIALQVWQRACKQKHDSPATREKQRIFHSVWYSETKAASLRVAIMNLGDKFFSSGYVYTSISEMGARTHTLLHTYKYNTNAQARTVRIHLRRFLASALIFGPCL